MAKTYCITGLLIVLLLGCKDSRHSQETVLSRAELTFNKFVLSSEGIETDENSLIFLVTQPWDTSFVVILKKYRNDIRGVCYLTNREYSFDSYDYLEDKNEVLALEGFSFKVDSVLWNQLILRSGNIKKNSTSKESEGCLDCPYYFLSYNSEVIGMDQGNVQIFSESATFLKKELLRDLFNKRVKRIEQFNKN